MMQKRPLPGEDLQWVRDFLQRQGGIQETLEKSRRYLDSGINHIEMFPDSEEKRALVKLADKILHRTY